MRKAKARDAIARHLNNKFDQFDEQPKKAKKATPNQKDLVGSAQSSKLVSIDH